MLASGDSGWIRNTLLQKLKQDVGSGGWQACHLALTRQLLASFSGLGFHEKHNCGYVLAVIAGLEAIPVAMRREVLQSLLTSKHVSIRRHLYRELQETDMSDFARELETAWLTYSDKGCARLFVKSAPQEFLDRQFDSLWKLQDERTTIALFMGARLTSERLSRLRRADGISYAYICAKRGIRLSYDEAYDLWEQYALDKKAGLLLWCFGQMKLRNLLLSLPLDQPRHHVDAAIDR